MPEPAALRDEVRFRQPEPVYHLSGACMISAIDLRDDLVEVVGRFLQEAQKFLAIFFELRRGDGCGDLKSLVNLAQIQDQDFGVGPVIIALCKKLSGLPQETTRS